MAGRKSNAVKAAEAAAKAAEAAAKTEADETKAESIKTEEKKAESKAAAKKETVKKETVKKEPEKKTAAKTAVKTASAKKAEQESTIHVQFAGKSYSQDALVEIAKNVWEHDLKKDVEDLESIELYVKPEESKVYYVINGDVTGDFAI